MGYSRNRIAWFESLGCEVRALILKKCLRNTFYISCKPNPLFEQLQERACRTRAGSFGARVLAQNVLSPCLLSGHKHRFTHSAHTRRSVPNDVMTTIYEAL